MNNHVFFQHPDLVRILCIHENVIAIMMNSISRSSQDGGEGAEQEGQEMEEVSLLTVPRNTTGTILASYEICK